MKRPDNWPVVPLDFDRSIAKYQGLWWPKFDSNPQANLAKVRRRETDVMLSVELVTDRRVVVQAGGHVGIWPLNLSKSFERVYSFEPDQRLFECMMLNVAHVKSIVCSCQALGDCVGHVCLLMHPSAGSWCVADDGDIEVEAVTIDSLYLDACGLIVLDVEGHEIPCLCGASETIKRFSPVLHLEAPKVKDEITAYLTSIGYSIAMRIHSDIICVRRGAR